MSDVACTAALQRSRETLAGLLAVVGAREEGRQRVAELIKLWRDGSAGDPDERARELESLADGMNLATLCGHTILLTIAYSAEAEAAAMDGDALAAWDYVSAAAHWHGGFRALWRAGTSIPTAVEEAIAAHRSAQARRAAEALHKDDRAAREYVRTYYAEHRDEYPSKDAAAEDFARRRLVAAEHSTIRRWLRGA